MSDIRHRNIGTDTYFNNNTFLIYDLTGNIDLSLYVSQAQLEEDTFYLLVTWSVIDEAEATGAMFCQRFAISYDSSFSGGNYITVGTQYAASEPIYMETFGDGVFEWSTEGAFLSFSGDSFVVQTSIRTPNSTTLRLRSYYEFYVKSDII